MILYHNYILTFVKCRLVPNNINKEKKYTCIFNIIVIVIANFDNSFDAIVVRSVGRFRRSIALIKRLNGSVTAHHLRIAIGPITRPQGFLWVRLSSDDRLSGNYGSFEVVRCVWVYHGLASGSVHNPRKEVVVTDRNVQRWRPFCPCVFSLSKKELLPQFRV